MEGYAGPSTAAATSASAAAANGAALTAAIALGPTRVQLVGDVHARLDMYMKQFVEPYCTPYELSYVQQRRRIRSSMLIEQSFRADLSLLAISTDLQQSQAVQLEPWLALTSANGMDPPPLQPAFPLDPNDVEEQHDAELERCIMSGQVSARQCAASASSGSRRTSDTPLAAAGASVASTLMGAVDLGFASDPYDGVGFGTDSGRAAGLVRTRMRAAALEVQRGLPVRAKEAIAATIRDVCILLPLDTVVGQHAKRHFAAAQLQALCQYLAVSAELASQFQKEGTSEIPQVSRIWAAAQHTSARWQRRYTTAADLLSFFQSQAPSKLQRDPRQRASSSEASQIAIAVIDSWLFTRCVELLVHLCWELILVPLFLDAPGRPSHSAELQQLLLLWGVMETTLEGLSSLEQACLKPVRILAMKIAMEACTRSLFPKFTIMERTMHAYHYKFPDAPAQQSGHAMCAAEFERLARRPGNGWAACTAPAECVHDSGAAHEFRPPLIMPVYAQINRMVHVLLDPGRHCAAIPALVATSAGMDTKAQVRMLQKNVRADVRMPSSGLVADALSGKRTSDEHRPARDVLGQACEPQLGRGSVESVPITLPEAIASTSILGLQASLHPRSHSDPATQLSMAADPKFLVELQQLKQGILKGAPVAGSAATHAQAASATPSATRSTASRAQSRLSSRRSRPLDSRGRALQQAARARAALVSMLGTHSLQAMHAESLRKTNALAEEPSLEDAWLRASSSQASPAASPPQRKVWMTAVERSLAEETAAQSKSKGSSGPGSALDELLQLTVAEIKEELQEFDFAHAFAEHATPTLQELNMARLKPKTRQLHEASKFGVAEYLQSSKPSLAALLTQQAQSMAEENYLFKAK